MNKKSILTVGYKSFLGGYHVIKETSSVFISRLCNPGFNTEIQFISDFLRQRK